ncbi:ABC1 kinase family protein [Nocardia huaxiensis]|uniref:AarF/ABC1/UbiB kinase family protein n=1 Tax=Nocardia huaxiensis TaxID=2755382 RepID=A0A7D6ZLK1_9NOCA|nr:AarF/UbiB family protein [Nocardia huaxiensis]QLY28585.1 AarF/ABC1/UbiB kinase family protein [Nocardia huaxiensis]UFS97947.1 AarF/UbiB family protein [Nocardia huaxiensis]
MDTAHLHRVGYRARLTRASQITRVLWNSETDWLTDALSVRECGSVRCRLRCAAGVHQCPHHQALERPLPERIREVLEQLGPTFVKLGQMLALRPDYLPLPYAQALQRLHTHAEPFGADAACRTIETELGRPIERLFRDFDPQPFAAASLSQVHRAELPDGRPVAVKVQRPDIADLVARDLALLRWLAGTVERRQPGALGFRPTEAVDELAAYTTRELDFRREAAVSEQMRHNAAVDKRLVVPAVHRTWSTARVLTTEFIDGIPPAPAAELTAAGFKPDKVLNAGASWMVRQLFTDGLFHADPHPGNILLLPGNRVCLLDFGMFGRLDRTQRRRMGLMLLALISGDYNAVGTQLLRMSTLRPGADPRGFRDAVAEVVEDWYEAESGMTAAQLLLRDLGLGGAFGIVFPRELMLLCRSLVTLESTARVVRPDLDLSALFRPLLPQLLLALAPTPGNLWATVREQRIDYLALVLDLPDLVVEVADALRHRGVLDQLSTVAAAPPPRDWLPALAALATGGWLVRRVAGR